MINIEALEEQYQNFPPANEQEIIDRTKERIKKVADSAKNVGRFAHFHIYMGLTSIDFRRKIYHHYSRDHITGRIDPNRLQELQIQAMKDYGLDEDIFEKHRADTETTSFLLYPSTTHKGLGFERRLTHADGVPLVANWHAVEVTERLRQGIIAKHQAGQPAGVANP